MRWMILTLALLIPVSALGQEGTGALNFGKGTIRVRPGCGSNRQPLYGTWVFTAGTFTATTTGNPVLAGTSTARTPGGRRFNLTFGAPSKALFDDALESWASAVCGVQVVLSQPTTISRFALKLNKRRTRARVALSALGNGTSAAGDGTGRYKAIVRGSWQPAP